jgi:serine phosphatase RsbU (regulator of sigma subunit)
VEDEVPLRRMVLMLNNTLAQLLPRGRFVSAALVVLDQDRRIGAMWLGGMPDVIQLTAEGSLLRRFSSDQLPLGIESWQASEISVTGLEWRAESQLLLCSDGLIEAQSAKGEEFGYEGMLQSLAGTRVELRLDALLGSLARHLGGQGGHDDISMLLLDLPA